jgi:hypothetical protein
VTVGRGVPIFDPDSPRLNDLTNRRFKLSVPFRQDGEAADPSALFVALLASNGCELVTCTLPTSAILIPFRKANTCTISWKVRVCEDP